MAHSCIWCRFCIAGAVIIFAGRNTFSAYEHPGVGPRPDRAIDESRVTYFVSPDGDDMRDGGTRATAWATLQKAADALQPGETALALKGIYKQPFHIAKVGRADAWITFLAEPGAEIRGSDVRTDWERLPGDQPIYFIERPTLSAGYQQPETPLTGRTEQVFVNDRLLRQAPDFAMLKPRGIFYVNDTEKRLYVCLEEGKDPNQERTEVTARTYAVAIGGPPNQNFWRSTRIGLDNRAAYIRLDGFRVRHIGNWGRMAAVQVRGLCEHIVIENFDVQWANVAGFAVSGFEIWSPEEKQWISHRPEHVIVRHCIASNCGVQGMGGGLASHVTFEYNLLDRNNYKGVSPWHEGGAIKTGFGGSHIVIRGNVARNNDNHGLWIDYGSTDCVIENNFVFNSLAGAILNEVTPAPPLLSLPGGEQTRTEPDAEAIRALKQTGTIIRNNICVATRTPGGGGICLSNGNDGRVYNNITTKNNGMGLAIGGSPQRTGTAGQVRSRLYSNISLQDFTAAQTYPDSFDPSGRVFDNLFHDNLVILPKANLPFMIQGEPAGPEAWKALNGGRENVYLDRSIFRDPDRFDFTLTDEAIARKIGFDPETLRLDWSEYYEEEEIAQRTRQERNYTPIDMSAFYNRGIVDEKAGDGQGGWSDQGPNDMRKFPTGDALIDGIPYQLGSQEMAALLLDTSMVKPGGFPTEATIPVDGTYDELNFLYAAAWCGGSYKEDGRTVPLPPEKARFVVTYENGSRQEIPVLYDKHLLDWWCDPTWQQYAMLNDHGVYAAWQGPNGQVGKVSSYCMRWPNPHPELRIKSVSVFKALTDRFCAFFWLGLTGANRPSSSGGPTVLRLGFDGDVDAIGSSGETIEAGGYNKLTFDVGTFVPGIRGQGLVPKKYFTLPPPADFPLSGEGAISVWLKADPWRTPERSEEIRKAPYKAGMTPFEGLSIKGRYSPWCLSFRIDGEELDQLRLTVLTGGHSATIDVTENVKPDAWFHVLSTWRPHLDKKNQIERVTYLDGQEIERRVLNGSISMIGELLYIGVASNGGQPWRGVMDELTVWKEYVPPERVEAIARSRPSDAE